MKTDHLALYMFAACPYCQRVLHALARLALDLELRDVRIHPEYRQELVEATGRGTVPCLRIEEDDGSVRWLHESLDIIAFLDKHFGTATAGE
jgi:glutathione S-transferase